MSRDQVKTILLYLSGLLVTVVNAFLISLTGGFGIDPEPDFRNTVAALFLYVALLSIPAFLITIKWSHLGCLAMCSILATATILVLLSGMYAPCVTVLVVLIIQTVIANAIDKHSRRLHAQATEPQT